MLAMISVLITKQFLFQQFLIAMTESIASVLKAVENLVGEVKGLRTLADEMKELKENVNNLTERMESQVPFTLVPSRQSTSSSVTETSAHGASLTPEEVENEVNERLTKDVLEKFNGFNDKLRTIMSVMNSIFIVFSLFNSLFISQEFM